jgi:hypothetical protein
LEPEPLSRDIYVLQTFRHRCTQPQIPKIIIKTSKFNQDAASQYPKCTALTPKADMPAI